LFAHFDEGAEEKKTQGINLTSLMTAESLESNILVLSTKKVCTALTDTCYRISLMNTLTV